MPGTSTGLSQPVSRHGSLAGGHGGTQPLKGTLWDAVIPKMGRGGQITQRGAWGPQRGGGSGPPRKGAGDPGVHRDPQSRVQGPQKGVRGPCRDEETPPKMDAGTLRGENPQISERVQGPQRRGQRDCRGAEGLWGVWEPQGAAETTVSPGDVLVPVAAHHGQSSGDMVALGMWWLWGHVVALRMR